MADEVLDFLRVGFTRLNERIDRIEADMPNSASGSAISKAGSPGSPECTPSCRREWIAWTAAWNASSDGSIWSARKPDRRGTDRATRAQRRLSPRPIRGAYGFGGDRCRDPHTPQAHQPQP
jgi:hypothetical protein